MKLTLNRTGLKYQSDVINLMRFPLMVAIVFIHNDLMNFRYGTNYVNESLTVFPTIFNIISGGICRIAVPLFFVISGYLFFYNLNEKSAINYINKLHRRVQTLVIPYVLWNTLYIGFFAISQQIFPSYTSGNNKLIVDYSVVDYIHCYWDIIGGLFPINGSFWFLRDLIIVSFLSPIIYWIIRISKGYIILLLLLLWINDIGTVGQCGVLRIDSFLFYSIGAWLSSRNLPIAIHCRRTIKLILFVLMAICIIGNIYNPLFTKGIIILGLFLVPSYFLDVQLKKKFQKNRLLQSSTFFLYAFHGVLITFLGKLSVRFFLVTYDWQFIVLYILLPVIVISISIITYKILDSIAPRILRVLIGKR